MQLICHVTSYDQIIDSSCEFMGGSALCYLTTLENLVTKSIGMVEICF